jgi:hypothetical protein
LQVKCNHIVGTNITWHGTFKAAKVTMVTNSVEKVLGSLGLPTMFNDALKCLYGEEYGVCDQETMAENEFNFCTTMTVLGHECHVKNHDEYSFQVSKKKFRLSEYARYTCTYIHTHTVLRRQ